MTIERRQDTFVLPRAFTVRLVLCQTYFVGWHGLVLQAVVVTKAHGLAYQTVPPNLSVDA